MIDLRDDLTCALYSPRSGQTEPNLYRLSASQPISGRATSLDDGKPRSQPQGSTGPLITGSGGTTAASS
jgi:hypothetical protein